MKDLHNILKEITELTTHIETSYPELYRSLQEIPMTIPTSKNPNVDKIVMQEYLESLKQLLEHYVKEEKVRISKS